MILMDAVPLLKLHLQCEFQKAELVIRLKKHFNTQKMNYYKQHANKILAAQSISANKVMRDVYHMQTDCATNPDSENMCISTGPSKVEL